MTASPSRAPCPAPANLTQIVKLAEAYAPLDKTTGKPRILSLLEAGGVQQVMLEVRVAEMSRSLMRRLGVNFNYISNGTTSASRCSTASRSFPRQAGPATLSSVTDNVNWIFQFTNGNATWTTFVDALKENGLTKVLAEPTLITLSGRSASFLAGGEYPIPVPQSSSGGGTTITIEYKTFGVGLNFTPTVLGNGKISMMVNPEVSDLDFTRAVSLQGYHHPERQHEARLDGHRAG